MPLIYNHPQLPPNGQYEFADASGVTLRDSDLASLVLKVQQYRTSNGLPQGNVEAELEAICGLKYPWVVSRVQRGSQKPVKATETPAMAHYWSWLNKLWGSPIKDSELATEETEANRVEICRKCKYAVSNSLKVVSAANSIEVVRRLMVLGRGKLDLNAPSCSLNDWHCGLAAKLREPKGKPSDVECWGCKPQLCACVKHTSVS